MKKSPEEFFEDMTAELTALRREINAKVMTKEQAASLVDAIAKFDRRAALSAKEIHKEVRDVSHNLSEAAGKARKAAWMYFGGFWVWLFSVLFLGVALGSIGTGLVGDFRSAEYFGENPMRWCEAAGGEKGPQDGPKTYCVFWLNK